MKLKLSLSLNTPIPPEVFRFAIDQAYNQIVITDSNGIIVYANHGLERITGFTPEEVIGSTPKIWGGLMPKSFYIDFWKQIKSEKHVFHGEIKNKRKDGSVYYALITVNPILDYDQVVFGYIATEEEITAYKN